MQRSVFVLFCMVASICATKTNDSVLSAVKATGTFMMQLSQVASEILMFSPFSLVTTISAANVPGWTGQSVNTGLAGSELANNFFLSTRTIEGNDPPKWTYDNPLAYPGAQWTSCLYYDHGYQTPHYDDAPALPSGYWYNPDIPKSIFDYNGRSNPNYKPSQYVSANCARGTRLGTNDVDQCTRSGTTATYYSCCYQYDKYYNTEHLDACSTTNQGGSDNLCFSKYNRCCYNPSDLIDYTNFGSNCDWSHYSSTTLFTNVGSGGVKLHQAMKPDRCHTETSKDVTPDNDKTPAMFFYRDSDSCLQNSGSEWSSYTCASATSSGTNRNWCISYARDMLRCCPESCGTGVLTPNACDRLPTNTGNCDYDYYENGYDNGAQKCEIRINCQGSWSQWSQYSSAGCGSTQSRTRSYSVTKQPMHGGTACPSPQTETRSTNPCPVNCAGTWSEWSQYSPTCGSSQARSRSFGVTVLPAHGGTACPTTESQSRSAPACPDPTESPTDEPTIETTSEPTPDPTYEPTAMSTVENSGGGSNTLNDRMEALEAGMAALVSVTTDLLQRVVVLETGTASMANPTLDPTTNPTQACAAWCDSTTNSWRCSWAHCKGCSFCT